MLGKRTILSAQHVQKDMNERDFLERSNVAAFAQLGCGKIRSNFE